MHHVWFVFVNSFHSMLNQTNLRKSDDDSMEKWIINDIKLMNYLAIAWYYIIRRYQYFKIYDEFYNKIKETHTYKTHNVKYIRTDTEIQFYLYKCHHKAFHKNQPHCTIWRHINKTGKILDFPATLASICHARISRSNDEFFLRRWMDNFQFPACDRRGIIRFDRGTLKWQQSSTCPIKN